MMEHIQELVGPADKILVKSLEPFDFENPQTDPVVLAKQLAETMLLEDGIGLAANQIGVPYRACAIKASPIIVMFNPVIVGTSEEYKLLEEGCLTFPNLIVKVKRPTWIRVRYKEPNGEVQTKRFEGLTARIICHEVDHLDGILFWERASRYHKDQAFKNLKLKQRKMRRELNNA